MADEEGKVEDKVKAAVSSLGEGCSTLIAVYLGAVIVALVITYFQRRDPSQTTSTAPARVSQDSAVVLQENSDLYVSPEPPVTVETPYPEATTLVPPTATPLPNPDIPATVGTGVLITQEANSSVNVRESPALSAAILHVGYAGDDVNILDQSTDSEGAIWYYVEFLNGSAVGWVHGDYLQRTSPETAPYGSPSVIVPSSYQQSLLSTAIDGAIDG